MRKRSRALLAFMLIAFAGGLMWLILHTREPHYAGRSLSSWLNQLESKNGVAGFETDGGLMWDEWHSPRSPEEERAAEAIRQIGTNSFPYLLHALTNKDSRFMEKLKDISARESWITINLPRPNVARRRAVLALDALGPMAEPVLPELTQALFDKKGSKGAAAALSAVGPKGWSILTRTLNSTNDWSAIYSVWALGHQRVATPETMEALISAGTNRNNGVHALSGWALGMIGQEKERVIPLLITRLSSPSMDLRFGALAGLSKFGTEASNAVPAMLDLMKENNSFLKPQIDTALKAIDPDAAAKASVK
ncbi:HEAT repeat domain-containing protein [Pedosphaera parvula]|uniref:PBS lyase HEAT domain protein repeat-containing protein n=1 Tax=Pedosphaera parvula (strain Ellin514) TaxID=320771 RepID=B9X9L6_PEDPL|nr:HEAT repeat domain-containing protein [Pedosphaera parvula]EEF63260.1 PBS lyase HEAT domain protein repeat-containing protein [Pedosphaera parvula Ellin514]